MSDLCRGIAKPFSRLQTELGGADRTSPLTMLELEHLRAALPGLARQVGTAMTDFADRWTTADPSGTREYVDEFVSALHKTTSFPLTTDPTSTDNLSLVFTLVMIPGLPVLALQSNQLLGKVYDDGTFTPSTEKAALEKYQRFWDAWASSAECRKLGDGTDSRAWTSTSLLDEQLRPFGLRSDPVDLNDILVALEHLPGGVGRDTFWFDPDDVPSGVYCDGIDTDPTAQARLILAGEGVQVTLIRHRGEGKAQLSGGFEGEVLSWIWGTLGEESPDEHAVPIVPGFSSAADLAAFRARWPDALLDTDDGTDNSGWVTYAVGYDKFVFEGTQLRSVTVAAPGSGDAGCGVADGE